MPLNHEFARNETFPSWFANRIQDILSGAQFDLNLSKKDATTIQVVPREPSGLASIVIQGRWRYNSAAVERTVPGDGTFTIWAVSTDNDVDDTPDPFTDHTDYAWELRITDGTDPAGVGVEIFESIGTVVVAGGAITSVIQSAFSVTESQIANDAVTSSKIAADAVGSSEIAANAVTSSEIASGAVGADEIAADAVGSSEIAANAVTSSEIAADAVGSSEIAASAVGSSELGSGAVTSGKIGSNAVDGSNVTPNAIGKSHIADDGVGEDELDFFAAANTGSVVTGTSDHVFAQVASVPPGLYHVVGHIDDAGSAGPNPLRFDSSGGAATVFNASISGEIRSVSAIVDVTSTTTIRLRGQSNAGLGSRGAMSIFGFKK